MAPKTGVASNVIETLREPVRDIKKDVKKQIGNPLDLVKMLYVDPEHKFKTEEELKQIENRERMEKLEGFKQARRELNALQGRVISEETIDEETRLAQNLQNFDVTSKNTAESLGQETRPAEVQAEQQKETQEEQEVRNKKEQEKANLETQIEAPQGRVMGLSFKRKRTATRMRPPKSAETRSNRE